MIILFGGIHRRIERIRRGRKIANVLIKHGFGHFIERLDPKFSGKKDHKRDDEKTPVSERARLVLEELGPTFVKFGQMLSLRPDLIPPEFVKEFRKLQDSVPGFGYDDVESAITKELGSPIDDMFSSFDKKPLAAASIAQVHKAVLGGEDIVVKIQRPRIEETIDADLDILFNLARLTVKHIPESELYNPVGIVEEFTKAIRKELDFTIEGRNIDRFLRNFKDDPTVCGPKVYWNYTSKRILTMGFIKGTKLSELGSEIDKETRLEFTDKIAQSCMKQILVHGFFHADPHPGNLFVTADDKIAFIDFGIVGTVDEYLKEKLASLFIALMQKDTDRITNELLDIGMVTDETSLPEFRSDIAQLIETYYGTSLHAINISVMLNEGMETALRHRVRIPADFALLIKSIVTLEGVCRELNPEFNLTEAAKPFAESLITERMHPKRLINKMTKNLSELSELLMIMPKKINQILSQLEKGKLLIDIEHKGLNQFMSEIDIVSNRISVSLIISSIIIASSIILLAGKGPMLFDLPVFGIVGYMIVGVLGMALVISILRSGRF